MKKLSFYYMLKIKFSSPVKDHRFTLRCVPRTNERQEIIQKKVHIIPEESLSSSLDSFGNYCIFGHCAKPHDLFMAEVKGVARTGLVPSEYAGEDYQMGRYRYATEYTKPGDSLRLFFSNIKFNGDMSNLDKGIIMMGKLSEVFQYRQGVTDFTTTAEQAFSIGMGVCQDYAHILITLCRMAGIPARYVVGMLIGEGASHAWVEIFQDRRWYALDPTNMLVVNDDHIRISSGRDYSDCVINQGIMVGNANQIQEVEVKVEEITDSDIGGYAGGRKT